MKDTKIEKISRQIEAILFYVGDFMKSSELASFLDCGEDEINEAVVLLEKELSTRGIVLLSHDGQFSLGTLPEFSTIIEKVTKSEFERDLSNASLETLSVVLYKSPVTKKEIEYIRGVNCSFSIRNLLIRGLIERKPSKLDERIFLYSPTSDLLKYLGISKIEDAPNFLEVKKSIEKNMTEEKENNE